MAGEGRLGGPHSPLLHLLAQLVVILVMVVVVVVLVLVVTMFVEFMWQGKARQSEIEEICIALLSMMMQR